MFEQSKTKHETQEEEKIKKRILWIMMMMIKKRRSGRDRKHNIENKQEERGDEGRWGTK